MRLATIIAYVTQYVLRKANLSIIGVFTLTLFSTTLFAQEQPAFRMLPTAGINRITLNPAFAATGSNRWDVNLIEGSVFVANNYLYFRNTNALELIRHINNEGEFEQFDPEAPPLKEGEPPIYFDYFGGTQPRVAQLQTEVMGPSVAFRLGDRHTLGVFNRFRFHAGSRDIPENFSYYTYYLRPFEEAFNVEPFQAGAMAWAEVGINYSIALPMDNGTLRLGISPKWLLGYQGAYFKNNEDFVLEKLPGDTLRSGPVDIEFGYTDNDWLGDRSNTQANGQGWSVDIGMEYLFGDPDRPWSVGFSILDLGRINFDEGAVLHQLVQTTSGTIVGSEAYEAYSGAEEFDQLIQQFSRDVLGDSTASFAGNSFSMGLPTAASLQVKKDFTKNFAVAATYQQPMRVFANGPTRLPVLSAIPMYSTKWFSVAMPVSLYNWERMRLGAHLQLGWLHLGTEQLLSFVRKGQYAGSDMYVALKIQPWKTNDDRDRMKQLKRRSSETGCYYGFN